MLKVRIIPTLLWKGHGLVKGIGFDSWRRVGSILPAIKIYDKRDVDELALLDIAATAESRDPDVATVRSLGKSVSVPLTVGGGITNIHQIAGLLGAGADKVSINTAAHENPKLVSEAARYFGSQCVVVSIDVVRNEDGTHVCMSRCGSKSESTDPVSFARKVADLGAGEILLTSVERDGTMEGYDLELIGAVVSAVNVPVIASGGAGNYQHFVDAVKLCGASAVAAASIFHFTDKTPAEAKKFMADAGIPVRKGLTKSSLP
ncbi:imidazole glycerol phosphate synthase cyclase subunit [Bradyrhizobium sp. CB2312]|uniref:imidazole glycerol phosphate synthase subunit HisF n=1 Tax=Bradyrhizobium sp. CB2312 TaxID=3039155 RepID=UPI0024B1D46F|nr:imidazole glycerol phosphate synthase cyclase subunit [Bradyrhizobium sp. CB2312]WFU75673.1 imidazole glycerol phosphate synthase cyclase subunit [Bradyrhizobium sp. CB2312]